LNQKLLTTVVDCVNVGVDIVFVIDSSGSIGASNFVKVKQFIKDVINAFDIGLNKTRVGVVRYSSAVMRPFDLNTYDNKIDIMAAVDSITYDALGTKTYLGLDMMTNVSFTPANGARPLNEVRKNATCSMACSVFSSQQPLSSRWI
jgi:matrilin-3